MNRLHIAQVAHEVNRAYCASQGDDSQAPWAYAPKWQQDSALAGVDMHIANPDATPEQSHESWLAQKRADGWAYGEVKDADKKLHPCFLPYAELPSAQKAKDYLFRGVVHALHALPEPVAAAAPAAPYSAALTAIAATVQSAIGKQVEQGILVRYTGASEFTDRLYGSKLSFAPLQVRRLPGVLAQRFLRHADVFEKVADIEPVQVADAPHTAAVLDDTAALLEKAESDKATEDTATNLTQDMLDQVNQMDKDALQTFALEKFSQKVPKNLSVENMRAKVAGFVQQYGTP